VTDLFIAGPGKVPRGSKTGFVPPALLMSFSHDNDLTPLIAALGVWNDRAYAPLHPTRADPDRKFRSSYGITFAGRVALERISCGWLGTHVRLRVRARARVSPAQAADAARRSTTRPSRCPAAIGARAARARSSSSGSTSPRVA
jgi:hypothetical protein